MAIQRPSDANWPMLNQGFYQADPSDYFETRSDLLLLYAGRVDDLAELLASGIEYGRIRTGRRENGSDWDPSSEVQAMHQTQYVAAEAEVLFHHTIETLLRLYFAHAGDPGCPWFEMANVRSPGQFKKMVKERFLAADRPPDDEACREDIASVFLGQDLLAMADRGHLDVIENLEHSMRVFADAFITGAPQYNAAKHGFAIGISASAFASFRSKDGSVSLETSGPALNLLEPDGEPKRWRRTMAFVDSERSIAYQRVAVHMMRSLWNVGKAKYLGEATADVFLPAAKLHELLPREADTSIFAAHLTLDYEEDTTE